MPNNEGVMPALVAGVHVFFLDNQDVDARTRPGMTSGGDLPNDNNDR